MNLIAATTVDLDAVLIIIGICMILVVGILLCMLLIRLNKTVARFNGILKNKQKDIERTIGNLPDLTENVSDMASEVKNVAVSANKVASKVESAADSINPQSMFLKVPIIIKSAKKAFETVSQMMKKKKYDDDCDDDYDFDEEPDESEE